MELWPRVAATDHPNCVFGVALCEPHRPRAVQRRWGPGEEGGGGSRDAKTQTKKQKHTQKETTRIKKGEIKGLKGVHPETVHFCWKYYEKP